MDNMVIIKNVGTLRAASEGAKKNVLHSPKNWVYLWDELADAMYCVPTKK